MICCLATKTTHWWSENPDEFYLMSDQKLMHLGLVAPLPPTPAGAAEWVAAALPLLVQHARISCFVPDPEFVDKALRDKFDIRHIDERHDPQIDMLVYHIGNNPHHEFVFDALREGPSGLVEVHDGSLHHYIQERTLGKRTDPLSYVEFGQSAHGWAGRRLADMRRMHYRGTVELFLFDYLQTALDHARGVIVHSKYAEELVQLRCPRVHTWLVPLHAPDLEANESARQEVGIPEDRLLIAHLGFVTVPKRSEVYLRAIRSVLDRGVDVHFAFVGKPEESVKKMLDTMVKDLHIEDRVTVTGYLETAELEKWVQAVDVIVNLRAPHVGESSGSLAYGLAAGKPVIVQPVGSWAELPEDVVVRLPVTDDDAYALSDTIFALSQAPSIRHEYGRRAKEFAQSELDSHNCALRLVNAAREAAEREWTPPSWIFPARTVGALTFINSGTARMDSVLDEDGTTPEVALAGREALSRIMPARPQGRLLAIDVPAPLMHLLSVVWGYEIHAYTTGNNVGEIQLPARPGVHSCVLTVQPYETLESLSEYDVIVTGGIVGHKFDFLSRCNKALHPQGLLVVLSQEIDDQILDDCGFSPHVHDDHPGWLVPFDENPVHIKVGTKATLPLLSMLQS